jgi:hypothetical protein
VKRLALLSAVSLMLLASAVFAPVALAQEMALGEVDVTSVKLGQGGSVTVTGTIQCVEGYFYSAGVSVRQKTNGTVINQAWAGVDGAPRCATTGLQTFTTTPTFGQVGEVAKPFRKGPSTIQSSGGIFAQTTPAPTIGTDRLRLSTSVSVQRGSWIERAGVPKSRPFFLPLFTRVRGRIILGSRRS